MKKAVLLSIGLLTVILLSCSMLRVNALNSNEWSWTYAFDNTTYYQGDSGTVTITFTSNCPDQLQFSSLSVQFDWMTTPTTVTASSPNIATGNQYTFPAISFSIPSDATVGSHSFTISMQGQQKELLGWTSISPTGTGGSINVLDAYEKVYDQTIQTVQNSLNNAQNSNLSPDAQALLQQANNMYNQATTLAGQGEWQSAVNDLNSASNYISQALALPTPTPTIPEFPTIAVLAIFLVLSLFAVIVLTVRKRKIPSAFKS
ncbi:MAG: hypothetical protein ABSG33_05315 [Candidatus Bathyarchaeia archaeon]|jgi:archaellum component FlaF (FlaF/FlaG flagellin family)